MSQVKYHTLYTLKVINFFKAMYEEDYSVMVVRGESTDELNKEKFDILYDKFMQRGGGINYLHSIKLIKDITRISGKITVVESTLEQMRLTYSPLLNDIMKYYGFHLEFKKEQEPYLRDLEVIEHRLGADKLRLTLKQDELDALIKISNTGTTMTADGYIDMIWDMSLSFKLQINIEKISVNDLIVLMEKFKKHINNVNRNSRR